MSNAFFRTSGVEERGHLFRRTIRSLGGQITSPAEH